MNEIEITGLSKHYGNNIALNGIELTVQKGQFVSLFGQNGAGKSTLLGILSTLVKPTSGRARISNFDLEKKKADIRHIIAFITHNSMLYENLTAFENLKYFGGFYNIDNLNDNCLELLNKIGLYERRDSLVKSFSRGMKQRLAIARAFLHQPQIFLLDEPYSGLDQVGVKLFSDFLIDIKKKGFTVILATHIIEEGLEFSDRVLVLNRGAIALDSTEKYSSKSFKDVYFSAIEKLQ